MKLVDDMKKMSEIGAVGKSVEVAGDLNFLPSIDKGEVPTWQSIILFDGVLDWEKVQISPEIKALILYCFGRPVYSVARTEYAGQLQEWLSHQRDKAEDTVICPLKASLEDLAVEGHREEYSGRLNAWIFKPVDAEMEKELIVLTCRWSDGLFQNDYYIVGVIADTEDLERITDEWVSEYIAQNIPLLLSN